MTMSAFGLDESQEAMRNALRRYLDNEVAHLVDGYEDRAELPPRTVIRALREYGLLGGLLPEEMGGYGLGFLTYCTLLAEVSRVWPALRSLATVSNLALTIIAERGSPELRDKYLGPLLSGEHLAFFALTEPNVGSDASRVETRAVRDGNGWRLSGRKLYISNGPGADLGVVFARTGHEGSIPKISAFVVETRMAGFQASRVRGMGMHSCPLGELLFDDVRLPAENLIGEEGGAFAIAKHYLNKGRCFVAFVALGIAEAAVEASVQYAKDRRQFGRPIGEFQLVQQMIADMLTGRETIRLLACRAARSIEERAPDSAMWCSMAKRHSSQTVLGVCENALQVHGGAGYTREFKVERLYRDCRHLTIAEGTNQLQSMLIAQSVLGLSAIHR